MFAGSAWRARAYAADAQGRRTDAIALLKRAEEEAARYDRDVDAAVARYQLGLRQGGAAGERLVVSARQLLSDRGYSLRVLAEDPALEP